MRLLLDTCALIWYVEGNNKLSSPARAAIEDSQNDRYISHATAWEIAIKLRLGSLQLKIPFSDLFPKTIDANGFLTLLPKFEHYNELLSMPFHHRDPFDRLIVSQARLENLILITGDVQLGAYGVTCLW